MNVIHLICADGFSGLERVACMIIKALPEGYDGIYASPDGEGVKCAEKLGVKTVRCNTSSPSEVKKLSHSLSPCIFHAHDPHMALTAALAGVPFVAQLHSNCPWLGSLCPNSAALAFAVKKASSVICVSDSVVSEYIFKRTLQKKAVVLSNFIDKEYIVTESGEHIGEKYDLCCVGRLTALKRPELFVGLVSELKKKMPEIKAVMVGDGEMKDELSKKINSLCLSENITLTGFQQNPYKYMKASRIGVLTSSYEGFGLAAAECMLLGLPFLSYAVGGLPDIINEKCGRLCRSAEEMLSEAEKLLTDNDYYNKKSAAAKEKAERFCNTEAYMARIVSLYRAFT